jgi:hypothetical protein
VAAKAVRTIKILEHFAEENTKWPFLVRWDQSRRLLDPSLGDARRPPINQDPVRHTFSALEQWHRALEDQLFEMRCRLVIGEVLFLTIVFVQEKLVRPLDRLVRNEASAAGLGTAVRTPAECSRFRFDAPFVRPSAPQQYNSFIRSSRLHRLACNPHRFRVPQGLSPNQFSPHCFYFRRSV